MEGVAGQEGHGGFRKGKGKSRGVGGREIGKDAAMWHRHIVRFLEVLDLQVCSCFLTP